MRRYDFNFYLNEIHDRRNHQLKRILEKRFRSKTPENQGILWSAEEYNLENVSVFQEMTASRKDELLRELSQDRIREAYHIEKSGIAYGSKMTALSETIDERVLYGSFTGDEARHFKLIEKYYDSTQSSDISDNCFLTFLAQMIETAPKNALVFMIQILLEGWGLDHYSTMAQTCLDETLKEDLKSILDDEVVHHGSGVILFKEDHLSKEERECIHQSLISFLQMVQVGPLGVFMRLQTMVPHMDQTLIKNSLEEMEAFQETQKKLNTLKRLIKKAGAPSLIEELEHLGYFQAFNVEQMASCL